MSCLSTIQEYAFRSIGLGPRQLPSETYSLCEQFTLIGSGLIWNVYFGVVALALGFIASVGIALAKHSKIEALRYPADWFIFIFRGSPLFIQMFFAYSLFLILKGKFDFFEPFTSAWLGATIVLFLNTTAYSAEIFYGALLSIPRKDLEAADAYGLVGWKRFKRVIWPTMLRLAWPAYTNEAIFLFHATALVFFSGFPVWQQRGDALYYANYFADKTFNPFIPYPILAAYFVCLIIVVTGVLGLVNKAVNKHTAPQKRPPFSFLR